MYLVVSRWEPIPGHEQEFEDRGRKVRAFLRSVPGVEKMEGFRTEKGSLVAVVGYESREAYDRIVNDADGPFAKAAAEHGIEAHARWIGSEHGEAIAD